MRREVTPPWLAVLGLAGLALSGCAGVYPHRVLPEIELGAPSFYPTLEAYAGAPIVGGNSVRILLNGEEIFPSMVEAVRSARTSISYAQYYYEEGPVARELAEALAERCRVGVGVNVLLDGVGTLSMPSEYMDLMRHAGCHVVVFRPVRPWAVHRANNRNHRRILVVDGRIGFTGGSGVSRKWMGNGRVEHHWRDTDVRVDGPVVDWLQAAFAENWLQTTGVALGGEAYFPRPNPPRGSVAVQVVRSSPAEGDFAMYTTFLLAVSSARRSIRITNPYLLLDERLTTALLERVRRGIQVQILVPGAIDHNYVREASRASWGPLIRGGVKMYEYVPALLHAKTMVIDGVWATIGSTNLDNRSFALNEELNVVIYDDGVGRRLEAVFADDLAHAREVTYQAWKNRGFKARLLELLVTPFRNLL
jgi:cardiolipin synthase